MIDIKPIENKNINVNQIKTPRHLSKLIEFVVVLTIRSVIKSKSAEININIHCVSETFIQGLNSRYRGKDKVTNVLSFPCDALDEEFDGPRELGDIFLCLAYIEKEATDENKNNLEHFAHMLVHGVLHLLGYDHENESDAKRMMDKEVLVLSKLGVSNPYREPLTN